MADNSRSGRPSVITKTITLYMDRMLQEVEELSATKLHCLITRKFDKTISVQTLHRFLHQKLHWVVVRTKTGPMISEQGEEKGVCDEMHCSKGHDDIIWCNESSVQLVRYTRTVRVKISNEQQYKPVAKHAVKVHVWAVI